MAASAERGGTSAALAATVRWGLRDLSLRLLLGLQPCDTRHQRLRRMLQRALIRILAIQELLQGVDGLEADIDDLRARPEFAITQAPDEVFGPVCHRRNAVQSYLRRRPLDGVHRAEQPIDLFWIRRGLEGQQALSHNLQMFLDLWDEELHYLGRNFAIFRQIGNSSNRLGRQLPA